MNDIIKQILQGDSVGHDDLRKMATAEKIAATLGESLDSMTDEEILKIAQEVMKEEEQGGDEKKEQAGGEKSDASQDEEQAKKVAEAYFLGQVVAQGYLDKLAEAGVIQPEMGGAFDEDLLKSAAFEALDTLATARALEIMDQLS